MTDKTYNGWANYETWRVNLEIFDGFDPREGFSDADNVDAWKENLSDNLAEYADMILDNGSSGGLTLDYARAFLQNVNWNEIARRLIEDYSENNA